MNSSGVLRMLVRGALCAASFLHLAAASVRAQSDAVVVATGLVAPQGIEIDDSGRLWVAEQGTGNDDGRISVVTPDGQVHSFLTGIPSNVVQGEPESVHHLLIKDGVLWATLGLGETSPVGNLLRIDTGGFTPGDSPLSMSDVQEIEDVGSFVLGHAFTDDANQTNIYNLTFGPDDDLFIVDASANAVIRRASGTGTLSVFAELPRVPNPTAVGPPMSQAVPTGIVFKGDRFYVSAFPGFPFAENASRIFEIDLEGSVSVHQDGLTAAVDLALDPSGNLVVAQFGLFFPASGFQPQTGSIMRLSGTGVQVLASMQNFPAGIDFAPNGDLYFTSFRDGLIMKLEAESIGTDVDRHEELPHDITLVQNYPNPFNPTTTIEYRLSRQAHVRLSVHDLLGQEVRRLVDSIQPRGIHTVEWDGSNEARETMPSGIYLHRISGGGTVQGRMMHLVK